MVRGPEGEGEDLRRASRATQVVGKTECARRGVKEN
jgi:hypothetical protein